MSFCRFCHAQLQNIFFFQAVDQEAVEGQGQGLTESDRKDVTEIPPAPVDM